MFPAKNANKLVSLFQLADILGEKTANCLSQILRSNIYSTVVLQVTAKRFN